MADLRFYHLQRRGLDDVLPGLLERILERGHKILVRLGSRERVEAMDQHLWTWRPESFLPHGTVADGEPERQPVLLTDAEGNPGGADVLVLADGAWSDGLDGFAIVCVIFDGNDDRALATAREQWRRARGTGHALTYWQQGERGGWEKRA
jgi:DNA polymerase III subunit chi